jgi:hypothetical protein
MIWWWYSEKKKNTDVRQVILYTCKDGFPAARCNVMRSLQDSRRPKKTDRPPSPTSLGTKVPEQRQAWVTVNFAYLVFEKGVYRVGCQYLIIIRIRYSVTVTIDIQCDSLSLRTDDIWYLFWWALYVVFLVTVSSEKIQTTLFFPLHTNIISHISLT